MKKFIVIGKPIANSLSPKLFAYIFKKLKLNYSYEKLYIDSIDDLSSFITSLESNICGINITSPYKVSIIKYLDYLDSSVIMTNNCNCINVVNKKLHGFNTDYFGFNQLLQYQNININNCNVLLIGSGGTARTLSSLILSKYCSDIFIYSRNDKSASKIILSASKYINNTNSISKFLFNKKFKMSDFTIINCTPLRNLYYSNSLINNIDIAKCKLFIDLNYDFNKNKNLNYINGNVMFIYQALSSLNIWFDQDLLRMFTIEELNKELETNE